jgi:hypothetical protein
VARSENAKILYSRVRGSFKKIMDKVADKIKLLLKTGATSTHIPLRLNLSGKIELMKNGTVLRLQIIPRKNGTTKIGWMNLLSPRATVLGRKKIVCIIKNRWDGNPFSSDLEYNVT